VDPVRTEVRRSYSVIPYTKVRISVVAGPDAGLVLDIAGTVLRVGTSAECDLVLTDGTVSRRHCELEPTPFGMRVRDSGSTNGIALEGARIYDAVIPGDFRISLGDTTLTIQWLGETIEREQALDDRFGDVIGRSPRMRELFAQLERIAATEYTLLVEGETGTGKDLIAESIHQKSTRATEPFVVFDCGAVSPTVIESELFGHERGAFTGAQTVHQGLFEQAHGGTLFLDEIGELPLDLQPKLLRVLERREVRRVGGRRTIGVDVRIIAATNRNLRAEMRRGAFRQDLYYRLAQAHVVVPPLRDREGDVELLVTHFLAQERPPRRPEDVPEAVWDMFRGHRWPGNVRELRNAVQRLVVTPDRVLGTGLTPAPQQDPLAPQFSPTEPLPPLRVARRKNGDAFEKSYVEQALALADGNVPRAAEIAEISRQMMLRLARKHGIR
jgi:transcriptional regulator with GAF, ATPase, and Fis domain